MDMCVEIHRSGEETTSRKFPFYLLEIEPHKIYKKEKHIY